MRAVGQGVGAVAALLVSGCASEPVSDPVAAVPTSVAVTASDEDILAGIGSPTTASAAAVLTTTTAATAHVSTTTTVDPPESVSTATVVDPDSTEAQDPDCPASGCEIEAGTEGLEHQPACVAESLTESIECDGAETEASAESSESEAGASQPEADPSPQQPEINEAESEAEPESVEPGEDAFQPPEPEPGATESEAAELGADEAESGTDVAVAGPDSTTAAPQQLEPLSLEQALDVAARLAPSIVLPAGCQPPLHDPSRLPNAPRSYRSGVHQGVDFACLRGSPVNAVLEGHVVVAVGDYQNPSPGQQNEVLAIAEALETTPPYTLVMLYGNYVVVDHGIIDGVGHVVSLYAHLEALDPAVRTGIWVRTGQTLGRIGNSGTASAAAAEFYANVHLHWELHVNGRYLGEGLSAADTGTLYSALLENLDR